MTLENTEANTTTTTSVATVNIDPLQQGQSGNTPIITTQHITPISLASELDKLIQAISDGPERILREFEQNSEHTREMQKAAHDAMVKRDKRGQWMAFCIIISTFFLTAYCLYLGKEVAALLSGLASIVLVTRGIFGPKQNSPSQNFRKIGNRKSRNVANM